MTLTKIASYISEGLVLYGLDIKDQKSIKRGELFIDVCTDGDDGTEWICKIADKCTPIINQIIYVSIIDCNPTKLRAFQEVLEACDINFACKKFEDYDKYTISLDEHMQYVMSVIPGVIKFKITLQKNDTEFISASPFKKIMLLINRTMKVKLIKMTQKLKEDLLDLMSANSKSNIEECLFEACTIFPEYDITHLQYIKGREPPKTIDPHYVNCVRVK